MIDSAALRGDERQRLDQFAAVFDRLDASIYTTLADAGDGAAVERAQADAIARLGSGPRHDAVRATIAAFTDQATIAYARRMSLTDTLMLFQSLPDRPEDRVRFLRSVERAVVAVILWDELHEADRDALLGPWASVLPADWPA